MPKKANQGLSVSFRPYTHTDNPFIVDLVRQHMKPILENAMGEPYNPEEFLYHVQTSQTRILESEGRQIGFFSYLPLPMEGRILFSSMILDKDFQGRGIGKKVFEFIEQEAVRLNCPEVECEVQKGNDGALKLYRELGYQEIEVPWENTIRLRKQIAQPAVAAAPATPNAVASKPAAASQQPKSSKKGSAKSGRKAFTSTTRKKSVHSSVKNFR